MPDRQKYRQPAELASVHRRLPRLGRIEVAPSGRARCRHCRQKIDKGSQRMVLEVVDDGMRDYWGYVHLRCVRQYVEGDVVPLLEARGDVLDEGMRTALSGGGVAADPR